MDDAATARVTSSSLVEARDACCDLLNGLLFYFGGLIVAERWLAIGKGIHRKIMDGTLVTEEMTFTKEWVSIPVGDEPYGPTQFCEAASRMFRTFVEKPQARFAKAFTPSVRDVVNRANLDVAKTPEFAHGPYTTLHSAAGSLAIWASVHLSSLSELLENDPEGIGGCLLFIRNIERDRDSLTHSNFRELVEQESFRAAKALSLQTPAVVDEVLSGRKQEVLIVMRENEATSSDRRMTAAEIAKAATGGDPGPFKEVLAELKKSGLVATKEGKGGGTWLTPKGNERARKL